MGSWVCRRWHLWLLAKSYPTHMMKRKQRWNYCGARTTQNLIGFVKIIRVVRHVSHSKRNARNRSLLVLWRKMVDMWFVQIDFSFDHHLWFPKVPNVQFKNRFENGLCFRGKRCLHFVAKICIIVSAYSQHYTRYSKRDATFSFKVWHLIECGYLFIV